MVKVASTVLRRGNDSQYHSLIRQDDEKGRKPIHYMSPQDKFISFCTCKKTEHAPICDGNHRYINK